MFYTVNDTSTIIENEWMSVDSSNASVIELSRNLSKEDIIKKLNEIYAIEEKTYKEQGLFPNVSIILKGFSQETVSEVLKNGIERDTLIDKNTIININFLINGYSTFDDDIFKESSIFFEDIAQFIDIKLDLTDSIREFSKKIVWWYVASLKSMHKTEYSLLDNVIEIPPIVERYFNSNTTLNISRLLSNVDTLNVSEMPLVKYAFDIIFNINSKDFIASNLLKSLEDNLKNGGNVINEVTEASL